MFRGLLSRILVIPERFGYSSTVYLFRKVVLVALLYGACLSGVVLSMQVVMYKCFFLNPERFGADPSCRFNSEK